MDSETEKSGSCLCGSVRVIAKPKSNSVGACHCAMCRKWGGGPLFAVECESAVNFEGAEYISTFSSSEWAERGFCRECGTHLFYRLKQEGHYAIPVGLFDGGDEWMFAEQIFIDQKPSFYSFAEKTRNLTGAEVFAQYSGKFQHHNLEEVGNQFEVTRKRIRAIEAKAIRKMRSKGDGPDNDEPVPA